MTSLLNIKLDKSNPYPIYLQLSETLRERIKQGKFKADDALPEEREMSRQFGISRPTLRKSLKLLENDGFIYKIRGRGVFISDKVETPVKKLDYSIRAIGISLFESFEESHIVITTNGATSYLREKNIFTLRMNYFNSKDEREHIRHNQHLLSGIITNAPFNNISYESERNINFARSFGLPVVLISHPEFIAENLEIDAVESDDFQGVKSVVDYFMKQGHRKITFFCCNSNKKLHSLRRDGYRKAMEAAEIVEDMIFLKNPRGSDKSVINDAMENALELFKTRKNLPTAILAENDMAAIGIYSAMKEMGISNNNLELIGYGNDIEARMFFPDRKLPFSTVAVDRAGIGRKAAELLLKRLEAPAAPFKTVKVPTKLIIKKQN